MDKSVLARWRSLDSVAVLVALADYAKEDSSFRPSADARTTRWHASAFGADFELLLTGQKFFDTRARRGGGGAIDLAMHLGVKSFKDAAKLLADKKL